MAGEDKERVVNPAEGKPNKGWLEWIRKFKFPHTKQDIKTPVLTASPSSERNITARENPQQEDKKLIDNRDDVLRTAINPWVRELERIDPDFRYRTDQSLPFSNPFVKDLIAKFNLPGLEKYSFVDLNPNKPINSADEWQLVSHKIYSGGNEDLDQLSEVEKIGGILGFGIMRVDTLSNAKSTQRLLSKINSTNSSQGGRYFVFVAPTQLVYNGELHLPLSAFNPIIRPSDLPDRFVQRGSVNLGHEFQTKEKIFEVTTILPLDWCIATFKSD